MAPVSTPRSAAVASTGLCLFTVVVEEVPFRNDRWMSPDQQRPPSSFRMLAEPALGSQLSMMTLAAVLASFGPRDSDDVRDQVRRLWVAAQALHRFGLNPDGTIATHSDV